MTRVLSELLGAKEPSFRLGLRQLEHAAGAPNADIRLTAEISRAVQDVMRDLRLDPNDTTGPELYNALLARAKQDDRFVRELLGVSESDSDLPTRIQHLIESIEAPSKVFALKNMAVKRLLKKLPPKKAMKLLGYRSLDSMLKHEQLAQIYAAASIAESTTWHKNLQSAYKQLGPSDFETRDLGVLAPTTARWGEIGVKHVTQVKQNIFTFRELGAVVLLPLPEQTVEGAALAVTVLALHAVNDIRVASAYLKLHQVRSDFGQLVAKAVKSEPTTETSLLGQALPWRLLHRYFARGDAGHSAVLEPHVQLDDLHWLPAENVLANLHDRLAFWQRGAHLALRTSDGPVSLNLTDTILNFCNHLPYEQRIVHYFRDHLWHELMLRYLHQENIEQMVHEQLDGELVDEKALA